jgi:hypothetical protein
MVLLPYLKHSLSPARGDSIEPQLSEVMEKRENTLCEF